MCNLYANIATTEAMRRIFQIESEQDHLGNAPSRPGIQPNYPAPIVRQVENVGRELVEMNWGFLTPNFSKRDGSPIKPRAWNNARDDSIFGKAAGLWKDSFCTAVVWFQQRASTRRKGKNLLRISGSAWRRITRMRDQSLR